jgi:hypothetical protein
MVVPVRQIAHPAGLESSRLPLSVSAEHPKTCFQAV